MNYIKITPLRRLPLEIEVHLYSGRWGI